MTIRTRRLKDPRSGKPTGQWMAFSPDTLSSRNGFGRSEAEAVGMVILSVYEAAPEVLAPHRVVREDRLPDTQREGGAS